MSWRRHIHIGAVLAVICLFDAALAAAIPVKILDSTVIYPNYRGMVFTGEKEKEAEISVTVNPEVNGLTLKDIKLVGNIKNRKEGKPVVAVHVGELKANELSLMLPIEKLKPGSYLIEVAIYRKSDNVLIKTNWHDLRKMGPKDKMPSVYVGRNLAIYADGKPFFPVGWFTLNDPQSVGEIDAIADMGFNCIMNYGINQFHDGGSIRAISMFLEKAEKKGVKIIYSLKDMFDGYKRIPKKVGYFVGEEDMFRGSISLFKDSPAILAWYTSDERPVSWLDRLKKHYDWAKELDPNHPVWICQNRPGEIGEYAGVTDIMGVDPYPVPDNPVTDVSQALQTVRKAVKNVFPTIAVIQTHAKFQYGGKGRAPTAAEIRVMTYLALVEGAKGIIYYSYFDFFRTPRAREKLPALKQLAREIRTLSPILLEGEDFELPEAVDGKDGFRMLAKTYRGTNYLIMVNTQDKERNFSISLGRAATTEVEAPFESRTLKVTNGRIADGVPPYGVHVFRWKKG